MANAGPDQTVGPLSLVTLNGSVSFDPDNDALTFSWVQTQGPPVNLSSAAAFEATFFAALVELPGTTLTFELRVSDGLATAVDSVNVIIANSNHTPGANAGPDQTRNEGSLVTLDGAQSRAVRSSDAAWVKRSRFDALTAEQRKKFLPLCPEFVVELRSPTDSLSLLQAKMQEYLDNGVQLAWLIDPEQKRLYVYRPGEPVQELAEPETVSGDPLLSGFVLNLREIW